MTRHQRPCICDVQMREKPKKIKAIRLGLGMNQDDFAKALGIKARQLRKYESGRVEFPMYRQHLLKKLETKWKKGALRTTK